MKTFYFTITDEIGIHARPAGLLVKEAKKFASKITLECGGKQADATRLMAIMGLGAKKGMELEVRIEGEDEAEAAAALEVFLRENL